MCKERWEDDADREESSVGGEVPRPTAIGALMSWFHRMAENLWPLVSILRKKLRAGVVAQLEKCLTFNHKALSSLPGTP